MGKATVLKVDGTTKQLDERPTLKEAQGIVGGYIELVRKPHNITLVVDEEGLCKGKAANQTAIKFFGGHLVGDIIVLEGWKTVGG